MNSKPLCLIVEDDADQQNIIQMVFEAEGYECALAADGLQAIELLTKIRKPDILLVDLMMPGMDGKELIQNLRRDDDFKELPIIVLTVVSDPQLHVEILDVGADDYCEKTTPKKVLLKRAEKLISRRKKLLSRTELK